VGYQFIGKSFGGGVIAHVRRHQVPLQHSDKRCFRRFCTKHCNGRNNLIFEGVRVPKGFNDERYRALIGILLAERKRLGLSQQALAEKIDMPQRIISRYEIGERRLDIIEFMDIAAALGLSASRLIHDVEQVA